MRYFVPDIRAAQETTSCSERLGGIPWGLPKDKWPQCKQCGGSQSLLAQYQHHADRLDLGREGRTLFVFQCGNDPGMCDDWKAFSGGNACFVIEPEELREGETPLPPDLPPLEDAVRIVHWIEHDDDLPPSLNAQFQRDATHLALDEDIHARVTWGTRLGGFPKWIQSAEEAPRDFDFVGQLDSTYSFYSPPNEPSDWIQADSGRFEGRTHVAPGPNFGGGLGYLLLKRSGAGLPAGCFFWQR